MMMMVILLKRYSSFNLLDNNEFDLTFLLTHKCFISSLDLLKCLKLRYNTPPPSNQNLNEFQIFLKEILLPIRFKFENLFF